MKVYGGDLVRAGDVIGRVKRTRVTFTVVEEGSETTYLLACPAWASGGEVWVNELEVTAVIEHGPHDYWQSRKGEGKRAHCRRCGIAKRDHASQCRTGGNVRAYPLLSSTASSRAARARSPR